MPVMLLDLRAYPITTVCLKKSPKKAPVILKKDM
jgi:hypothetical protein